MTDLKSTIKLIDILFEEAEHTAEPIQLYEPIEYTMHLGGKRIRPTLLVIANEMFGGEYETVKNAAIGIEMFHNFTLLHDDLMDNSPVRRGKPSVYYKWNANTAILSGDTMYALAWKYFLKQEHPQIHRILQCFNQTSIEVCEGQQYDMNFENEKQVSIPEYMEMIRLKTAVLLAGALKIGAIYANAPDSDIDRIYDFGIHLGLAFQLQDDLLDATSDISVLGKKTNNDICDNKKTFLIIKALEFSTEEQRKTINRLYQTKPEDPTEKIKSILEIYTQLDIYKHTKDAIESEFIKAKESLDSIQLSPAQKTPLYDILETIQTRNS